MLCSVHVVIEHSFLLYQAHLLIINRFEELLFIAYVVCELLLLLLIYVLLFLMSVYTSIKARMPSEEKITICNGKTA